MKIFIVPVYEYSRVTRLAMVEVQATSAEEARATVTQGDHLVEANWDCVEDAEHEGFDIDPRNETAEYKPTGFYKVHHDLVGWYIVRPEETEDDYSLSLGFDGRDHFDNEPAAWTEAARLFALDQEEK